MKYHKIVAPEISQRCSRATPLNLPAYSHIPVPVHIHVLSHRYHSDVLLNIKKILQIEVLLKFELLNLYYYSIKYMMCK